MPARRTTPRKVDPHTLNRDGLLKWLHSLDRPALPNFNHLPYAEWAELQAAHYNSQGVRS